MSLQTAKFSANSIEKVIKHYEQRSDLLARTASHLGHQVSGVRWLNNNWRFLTLRHLAKRLSLEPNGPALMTHLASTFGVSGLPLKRLILAAFVGIVRAAPLPIAMTIARRVINLRYM